MNISVSEIANHLMTTGIQGEFAKAMWEQWEYRKGKDKSHLEHARRKASRAGNYKLEREIRFAEIYVGHVLKRRRKTGREA